MAENLEETYLGRIAQEAMVLDQKITPAQYAMRTLDGDELMDWLEAEHEKRKE